MFLLNIKSPKVWILSVIALVALIVLFILFRHFILSRTRAKRIVEDIDRRFEYVYGLLVGQDAQMIKRLEIISQSNLLYNDIHNEYLKQYQLIQGGTYLQAQIAVQSLEEALMQKRFHDFYANLESNVRVFELFEAQIKELDNSLTARLKPEEDCRNASLSLKEKFRSIKTKYFEKQAEILSIEDSFTRAFNGIENQFNEYEKYVETAFYEEANNLLPSISKMLDELDYALTELPSLCMLMDSNVPSKIDELKKRAQEVSSQGIPLQHLCINSCISRMQNDLYDISRHLSSFELKGMKEKLTSMIEQIDCFHQLIDKEISAYEMFNSECDAIYNRVGEVEHQFVVLRQRLLKVKEVYRLDEIYFDRIDEIQKEINQLGITKHQLDTYIHAATKQPYTMLIQKMDELQKYLLSTEGSIVDYNQYIDSLRNDSDKAYSLVNDCFLQLKQSEKQAQDIGIKAYEMRLKDRFKQCYEYLSNIYNVLMESPINVKEINRLVNSFSIVFSELVNEIKDQYHLADIAEKAIVEANLSRDTIPDYDRSLERAERYFYDADFEKAYYEASATLKKIGSTNN